MDEEIDRTSSYIGTDENSEAMQLAWDTIEKTIAREQEKNGAKTRKKVANTGKSEINEK